MSDFVLFETHEGVATLTLNRPDERNALTSQAQWDEIVDCCHRISADHQIRAVVLTGAGSAFSAGGHVKDMRDKKGIAGGTPYDIAQGYLNGIQKIPLALHQLEVPTIAAVNGAAAGIGFACALFCDMRFFGESGYVASSFAKRGLIAEVGTAWILPKLVGLDAAFDILWSSRKIYGPDAKEMKLATRVCRDEELLTDTIAYINNMAENCSPASIAGMKGQLYRDLFRDPTESFKEAHRLTKATLVTDDFREGVASFVEKRKPNFSGIGKEG